MPSMPQVSPRALFTFESDECVSVWYSRARTVNERLSSCLSSSSRELTVASLPGAPHLRGKQAMYQTDECLCGHSGVTLTVVVGSFQCQSGVTRGSFGVTLGSCWIMEEGEVIPRSILFLKLHSASEGFPQDLRQISRSSIREESWPLNGPPFEV